ncbi:hypothetical protein [uncultured Kordia sp.]|uniref:hypothetical protein n=1 Tax=uncultured Kordia sp. TaxID=507699 RepID=UPI0026214C63|nr:hypothetical protein [uncultured Kordia sp.]
MKKSIRKSVLTLKKVNIANINTKHLFEIKGGTRSTAEHGMSDHTVNCTDPCDNLASENSCVCHF